MNNKDNDTTQSWFVPLLDAMVIKSRVIMEKGQKTLIWNLLILMIIDMSSWGRFSGLLASPMLYYQSLDWREVCCIVTTDKIRN